jgi:hypothetical protein
MEGKRRNTRRERHARRRDEEKTETAIKKVIFQKQIFMFLTASCFVLSVFLA